MKKLRVSYLALLLGASVVMAGCNNAKESDVKEASTGTDATVSATSSDGGEDIGAPTELTSIEFTEMEHDFGKIKSGEMVGHTFVFKNTGNAPLIVSDAKASCGCTIPEWTKDPIPPGGEGKIEVKYNGSGEGHISKTVTVTSNTDPATTVLNIKAEVEKSKRNEEIKGPYKNQ
ncbi:MAG TPA: DUF1573 domain-containing protein [Cytophagaceae bacterium]